MSVRVPLFLALAVPLTVAAAVACSSSPPSPIDGKGDDDDNGAASANQNLSSAPAPQPVASAAPTPTPKPVVSAAPPVPDAGLFDASLPIPPLPPGPTTHFCMQLSQCCGKLDSTNALACGATAVAGDETACGAELAVCQAGGIDFGGIGGFLGGLFGGDDDDSF